MVQFAQTEIKGPNNSVNMEYAGNLDYGTDEKGKRKKKRSPDSAERNRVMAKMNRERKKRELFELELRLAGLEGMLQFIVILFREAH